ncbi:hypothetical protein ANCDUO_10496, partial [Ancylostoma duodenale]
VLVGGTPVHLDVQALKRGVHIVVGTAGRICQMVQNGNLSMSCIDLFILDEADKLMEDCFQKDIKPDQKQDVMVFVIDTLTSSQLNQ